MSDLKKLPATLTEKQLTDVNVKLEGSGFHCSPTGHFHGPKGQTQVVVGWAKGNYLFYREPSQFVEAYKLWTGDPREFTRKFWFTP